MKLGSEFTPLGERSGTVLLEDVSAVDVTVLIEMIVDRGVAEAKCCRIVLSLNLAMPPAEAPRSYRLPCLGPYRGAGRQSGPRCRLHATMTDSGRFCPIPMPFSRVSATKYWAVTGYFAVAQLIRLRLPVA